MDRVRNRFSKWSVISGILLMASLSLSAWAGGLKKGMDLPRFQMSAVDGKSWSQSELDGKNMVVLSFFSTTCKSCVDALKQLDQVATTTDSQTTILAIAKKSKKKGREKVEKYIAQHGLKLPVLLGEKAVLKAFKAQHVFPTTYIIGPQGKVIDSLQGGGAPVEKILMAVAERQLQRKEPEVARVLYEAVEKQGGEEAAVAKAGIAYTLLKEDKLDASEEAFKKMAESSDPKQVIRGNEGLAEVYLAKGDTTQAIEAAETVIRKAPERATAHLVKSKVLFKQGKKEEAKKEVALATAADAETDFEWSKAEARYAKGNIELGTGESKIALTSYQKATEDNPYFVDALSNQGVALQEMGDPEKALEIFSKVKQIDPKDKLVHSLLRQAQSAIAQKQDIERQKYIDGLVTDLLTQFEANEKRGKEGPPADEWTTPPMVISILGFQNNDNGMLMGRAGLEGVLQEELTTKLLERNIHVVERAILDKLLAELKLGSSDLADQDTALKLGKIMAARLIATGSFFTTGKDRIVTLRLINTETTDISMSASMKQDGEVDPMATAEGYAQQIDTLLDKKFPKKGRIAFVDGDTVIINLGTKHGVTAGDEFKVVGEGKPIELNGRILGYMPAKLGSLKVTNTDELMAYAEVVKRSGEWEANQKIIQK